MEMETEPGGDHDPTRSRTAAADARIHAHAARPGRAANPPGEGWKVPPARRVQPGRARLASRRSGERGIRRKDPALADRERAISSQLRGKPDRARTRL